MRKSIFAFILLIILSVTGIIFFLQKSPSKIEREPHHNDIIVEQFIHNHLIDENGMIRTNFMSKDGGELYLSESNGLWLEFLSLYGAKDEFENAYFVTEKHLQLKEGIFSWRILEEERATTNALIDDLRIAESLFHMYERTEDRKYLKQAKEISKEIVNYHYSDHQLIDFYDVTQGYTHDKLTVSYVNLQALKYMVEHNILAEDDYLKIRQQMEQLPVDNDFYPMTYEWENDRYEFDDEINLIDQLYIVLHLERAGIPTNDFMTWLKFAFEQENKLYGRYDRNTKENTVTYESVAVYALAILYALEKQDVKFSLKVWDKLKEEQVKNPSSEFYGGYIDKTSQNTHSFDNLLALLAEGKMKDEQIIQ